MQHKYIEETAVRMGLEKAVRDYSAILPAAWSATTEPA
jgi:hypothetical protein